MAGAASAWTLNGSDSSLRRQQPRHVDADLADLLVRTREVDAVAAGRRWRPAHEMVALVDRHHEQRVGRVDAVAREAIEEGLEGRVVLPEHRRVLRLARAVGGSAGRRVWGIVRVADLGEGDRDVMLLHRRDVGWR